MVVVGPHLCNGVYLIIKYNDFNVLDVTLGVYFGLQKITLFILCQLTAFSHLMVYACCKIQRVKVKLFICINCIAIEYRNCIAIE